MKPAMSILFWLMNFWEFDPIVERKKEMGGEEKGRC